MTNELALEALYPRLSPGGFVIVDDLFLPPCREAVTNYRCGKGITTAIHEIDWSASCGRKE